MAISFIAAGTANTGSNPTVPLPANIVDDDFLVIITTSSATTSTPTGWTQIAAQGAGQFITAFYKHYNSVTDSAVALTNAGSSTRAVMVAYRGVGLHDVVGSFSTSSTTTIATNTQTTLLADDKVISIYASSNIGTRTWTAPGSTVTRFNAGSTSGVRGLLIVDEDKATAGVTTSRTATISSSATLAAVSISIREPQTLYWRGGTGNWNITTKTNWSLTSGGSGGVAVPQRLDNVIFDGNSGTGTTTINNNACACKDLTFSSFGGTLAGSSSLTVTGSWTEDGTTSTYSGDITFAGSGTGKTILTSATCRNNNITFNGPGSEWTLQTWVGNDVTASSRVCTLTAGTIITNNNFLFFGTFVNTGTATRSIDASGGGGFFVYGTNGTIIDTATTGFTAVGHCAYQTSPLSNGTGTRTITLGSSFYTESNAPDLAISNANDTISITSTTLNNLTFANYYSLSPSTITNVAHTIFGSLYIESTVGTFTAGVNTWTFAATSGTQSITTNGEVLDFPLTFNGVGGTWQLIDALTVGSGRTVTLTNGALDLNNNNFTCGALSTNNSNTRTIAFGTGQIYITGLNATVVQGNTLTGLTVTGTPVFNITGSGTAGQTRTIGWGQTAGGSSSVAATFNITAGADLVTFGGGSHVNDLTFTSFTGTSTIALNLYGNLTLASGMSAPSSVSTLTFRSTSGTKTITSNGVTIDHPVTFDGVGGTWQLVGALTVGSTRTVTLTNGYLDLNDNNFTCGAFSSSNSNTRTIDFGTGQFYLTGNSLSIWRTDVGIGLTVLGTTPGVNLYPTINATYSGSTGSRTIIHTNQSGTFEGAVNLNVTAGSDVIIGNPSSMLKNVNFTGYSGAAVFSAVVSGDLTFSSTMTNITGNNITLVNNTNDTQDITSNGITFDAPFNIGTRSTVLGASGDGTTATLTFNSSTNLYYPVGSTINVDGMSPAGYNGTYVVTASTLTSVSYTNSTTGALTVSGQVSVGGFTISLLDALTIGSTRVFTFNAGNFVLNNNNVTTGFFGSNVPCIRSITPGTGVFYCTGNSGSVVNLNTNTGMTQNGDLNFYCTYSGSTGTRTISGWGSGFTNTNYYITAGSDAFTLTGSRVYNNIDFTGSSCAVSIIGSSSVNIFGNFIAPDLGGSVTTSVAFGLNFNGANNAILKSNGRTIDCPISINTSSTKSVTLNGDLVMGATRTLTLTTGTLNTNNFNLTFSSLSSTGTGIRSLVLGTSTVTINGSGAIWNSGTNTNFTLSAANSTIVLQDTSTSSRTFTSGPGLTFGDIVFSGSNICTTSFVWGGTYGTWSSTKSTAFTIELPNSSVTIVEDWLISGSLGNLVTLRSSLSGTRGTLRKTSGTVSVSYVDIKDIAADGGARWEAYLTNGNVDSGNNLGWIFTANSGNFLLMF